MRTHSIIVGALGVTGCFGTGPEPETPAEATILFTLEPVPLQQENCMAGRFIGNVAIGSDAGYAVTHTFVPGCSGGMGNPEEKLPSNVFEFPRNGGVARALGMAGEVSEGGGQKPRVAARGADAVWVFQQQVGQLQVRSRTETIGGAIQAGPNANTAASIVIDATHTYVATWQPPGGPTVANNPRFPCCGTSGGPGGGPSGFFKITNEATTVVTPMPVSPTFFCEQMKDCLVGNTDTLFYIEHAAPLGQIASQPKDGTAGEPVAMLGGPPTGLAADDTHVAWSTSLDFARAANAGNSPACTILVTTAAAPRVERTLLSTTKFSCLDLSIDGNSLYFNLVALASGDSDPVLENIGIGRIAIDSGELETLALGIDGPGAGPRQLLVDGDDLFVAAPFIVARYQKSALDGRHDIAK